MDGSTSLWILGGYQSDFARNLTREDRDFAALIAEVVDHTLASAKVDATDIGVVHVANAFGEMFASQGHLGAMPATVCDELWDTPAARHEAACASGSVATLAAMADLRSGAYETALVVGIELEKTVPDPITDDDATNPITEGRLRRFDCSQMTDGGRMPINPSGGLIGGGHPVGASGVRMVVDGAKQVSGTAGDYQVEDAKTFGTLNFGGSTATTVSFVIAAVTEKGF
jgi:acetyl-CoA acetyltransferase